MKPVIFWGATGQAIVLEEMLTYHGYRLIAVIDNNSKVTSPFNDIPIIHGKMLFEKWLQTQKEPIYYCVAIGGDKGLARQEIGDYLESLNLLPASLYHPTAYVSSSASIGKAVQILAQAAVCVRVQLGNHVIINTSANVDHECIIGNGVHIGPGAKLAGCVEIGDHSFVGTGAVILPRIKIGNNVVVGAGAVVTKNIADNLVAYGNPAKIVKSNSHNE